MVIKTSTNIFCRVHINVQTNLQVDLLSEGRLIGQGSVDRVLEGEREDGGDPRVAGGAQLVTKR